MRDSFHFFLFYIFLFEYYVHFYLSMTGIVMSPKSYFVTNWKTAEVNEITYKGSFEKFIFQVGVVFRTGTKRRLYALKPGIQQDEKVRITNKAELEAVFEYIDENEEIPEAIQVLYVYPEDISPDNSPVTTPTPYINGEVKNESSSGKDESVKSDRSSNQKRFAKDVARRDVSCRLCGGLNALIGAHIVDVKAKLTPTELHELGIHSKYEIWNGVLLCAVCHHQYDYWQHGIDKDGFLWKKSNGQWIKDDEVNIYPSLEHKSKKQYPDPKLLEWKFERFVLKRNNVLARITCSLTSLLVSTPNKKHK